MSGSRRLSSLSPITQSQLEDDDTILIVDYSEVDPFEKEKAMKVSELSLRYTLNSEYNNKFDSRLATKSTNDIVEGINNLFYTQDRFNTAFGNKSTKDLSEDTNLYYTEDRVIANTNVAANTSARHSILTISTADTGLTLIDQALSNSRATGIANGFLHQDDFNTFNGKANRSSGDISELNFPIAEGISTSTDITGFVFDSAVSRSFEALVSFEIDATTKLAQVVKYVGILKGDDTWIMKPMEPLDGLEIGDDCGITLTMVNVGGTGQIRYTSGTYTGFVSGNIKVRAIVTTK